MRGGVLLLLIGIIMAYLAVSGKYKCFTVFASCVTGDGNCNCNNTTAQTSTVGTSGNTSLAINLPKLPALPSTPIITNIYG